MPRDNDKNNGRPSGGRGAPPRRDSGGFKSGAGKGRPGGSGSRDERPARPSAARSGERKFGDKKFGDKKFSDRTSGEKRSYSPRSSDAKPSGSKPSGSKPYSSKPYGSKPYGSIPQGSKPYAGKRSDARQDFSERKGPSERSADSRPRFSRDERPQRDERPARFNRAERPTSADRAPRKDFGEKRDFKTRGEGRAPFKPRDDRGPRKEFKPRDDRGPRKEFKPRDDRAPRKDFKPRDDHGPRKDFKPREDRGPRKEFNRGADRGPRKEFDRGADKPWQKRAPARSDSSRDDTRRDSRPPSRDGARSFDKPREDRGSRPDFKPREERGSRPDFKPRDDRAARNFDRPRFDRPREDRAPRSDRGSSRNSNRTDWQEHPRSENRESSHDERPRRDNEDDSKIFAKRPAFGGRGEYRERAPDTDRRPPRAAPEKKKTGERIAKLVSRAGLCSRRDAEEWIVEGRVAVNGRVINSPALDVTSRDVVTVDGKPLPERERTRLFLYHKPRGLMTTHADPEGRPTVFDNLPDDLPRLISIGRLDFNTEGLLLLTNDGGLARALELPDTGWLRRYRVRAHGEVTQAQLDALKKGVEVDGVKYGSIDATLERDKSANVWIVFAIREGKNREVRNVMAHLGLEVNRLIRISYGPFQLAELGEGEVEEVKTRVLREQLGDKIAASAGAQFDKPMQEGAGDREGAKDKAPRDKSKPIKPLGKNGLIADRKGRRVLVQRAGGEEARARNEDAAANSGPPRRPQRGYKGKRDVKPRD